MMIALPQGQLWTTSKGTSSLKWCSYVHRFNFNQYLWFFLLFYLLIFVFVYPSIPSIIICWMAPLTCSTCLCYYGSCMSKCLCALGASVLACLYALPANVPADLGTLHVYVPTFFVCPHVSRSHLSFRTHLPSVSTSMYNCVFMHFISVVSKTLLISDKGTDKEST